jgi:iron complex outermembrane receptor protein
VRVRAVPDTAYGFYLDYRFTEGPLKGFGANLGVDYKGNVAGENTTGYTTTKPIAGVGFVPNQPSFLVPARTLVNLGLYYRVPNWTFRLSITNLLDADYIMAAGARTSVIVGEPRAWKISTTYSF